MSDSTQLADQFLLDCATNPDPVLSVSKDKRVIHCVDNNNGSYQSGVTTIDATSQLNGSTGYGSLRDGYLVVPYVVTVKNTHATAALSGALTRFCAGLKAGVWNVIDSLSVELNGKSIITENDYKCYWNNLRAMTEWSDDDVVKLGADSFMYPDDAMSITFPQASGVVVASTAGDGYVNNATNIATTVPTGLVPEGSAINTGFVQRLVANPPFFGIADATGSTIISANGAWLPTTRSGAALTKTQQQATGAFVPYSSDSTNASAAPAGAIAGTWYYVLKIRLVDLHPIFKELDLIANPQLKLKIRYNTGYLDIITSATDKMELSSVSLIGSNTVPVMVASASAGNPMAGKLAATAGSLRVAFGVMQNSLTPLSVSGQVYPFTTTRLYIPFYDIANQSQIVAKPIKKIHYNDCYAQYFVGKAGTGINNTQQNVSFSFQLSASLKNIKYVALIPYSETSTAHFKNTSAANVQQFQSPFDSAPWTCQAGSSIRNFQVQIGNENVFNKTIDYDYEMFNDEFRKLAAVNGGLTHEISNGLIDLYKWSTAQRIMIADCSRITNPDVPQSVLISGTNNCSQGSNYLVLVVYGRSLSIDRLTGEVAEYEDGTSLDGF